MLTEVAEGKLKLSNKMYFLGNPRSFGIPDENRKIKAAVIHITKDGTYTLHIAAKWC